MPMQSARPGKGSAVTSLVLPAYNPGRLIERTWPEVRAFLDEARDPWEVLFVCDGCTDGTAERLAELSRRHADRVRVVSYAQNRGKGHALRVGLTEAAGSWRLFTDIDLAYGLDDVRQVARALRDGAEVVVGSRVHAESRVLMLAHLQGYAHRRHLQSRLFANLARLLLPVRASDPQAGLKGLSARAAQLLLPYVQCRGFGFDCELLTACARFGLAVTEVPVCLRYDTGDSTIGLGSAWRMLYELWTIRRAWRKGPPLLAVPLSVRAADVSPRQEPSAAA
jgi:dolichyl-phosphate beta-glucosyltransferase